MKKYVCMVEVLVSTAVLGAIVAILSGSLLRGMHVNFKLTKMQHFIMADSIADSLLRDSIESISLPLDVNYVSFPCKDKLSTFYTNDCGSELFFVFRPSMSRDPEFCNYVSGHVYISGSTLWFEKSSLPEFSESGRTVNRVVLMEDVESVSFEFYVPADTRGSSHGETINVWDIRNLSLPRMIKVVVNTHYGAVHRWHYCLYSNPFVFRSA